MLSLGLSFITSSIGAKMGRREIRAQLHQYYQQVGNRVTQAMQDKNVSAAELAVLCGVQTRHIRLLQRGVPGHVHGNIVGLVAMALEVSVADLEGQPPDFAE